MTTKCTLDLVGLDQRHPGVTKGIAESYSEAARVCLDRHHVSPVSFEIVRPVNSYEASTTWETSDARTRLAWGNEIDTTEAGAYCIALAAVEVSDGLVAISRAETGTGADYYLGKQAELPEDLEGSLRLEVSGVSIGSMSALKARLATKIQQSKNGVSPLPAIAAVVGFSCSTVLTADVEKI